MFDLVDFPPQTLLAALQAFFALAIGHALADFPLQGEFLATGKNRHFLIRIDDPSRPPSIWVCCMTAHCLIHAGAVWIVTGSSMFALVELVLHWGIDVVKCDGKLNFTQDQVVHILCKAGYVAVAWAGWV